MPKYKTILIRSHTRKPHQVTNYERGWVRVREHRRKVLAENYFLSGAGTDILKTLWTSSAPGSQKLQFPYEIPPIETVIKFDKTATRVLYTVTGVIVGGVIVNQLIKKFL